MAQQKGLLAFFKKSPAVDSKAKTKPTSAISKTTPTRNSTRKKRINDGEIEEDNDEAEFTPVVKSKKRRVLIDSDEEEVDDGALIPNCDDNKNSSGNDKENEGVEPMEEGLVNEEQQESGQDNIVDTDKTSKISNGRLNVESGIGRTDKAIVGGVTSTPPKRRTAMKHTGKVWSTPREAVQSAESEASPPTTTTTTTTTTATTTAAAATTNDGAETTSMKMEEAGKEVIAAEQPEVEPEKVKEAAEEVKEAAEEVKEAAETEVDDIPSATPKCKKEDSTCAASSTPPAKARDVSTSKAKPRDVSTSKAKPRDVSTSKAKPRTSKAKPRDVSTSKAKPCTSKAKPCDVSTSKAKPSSSQPSPAAAKGGKKEEGNTMFNPAQANYNPLEDATWQRGQKVPYLALARTFELIEEESKRLKIIATLTNFFRSVLLLSPEEMVQCVYLCLNKLAPAYEGLELGIGESILMKAIAEATGRSVKQIKNDAVTKGDLGTVAEASRSTQRTMFAPPKLTVSGVFTKLKAIAAMTGNASTAKKVNIIKGLFTACRHSEARYLIRSLGGKLRIGLAEQSVLMAISHAAVRTPPGQVWPAEVLDAGKGCSSEHLQKQLEEAALTIKTCYCEHPNYEALLPALISHGVSSLHQHCHLTPGIPLRPMLAHPTKGIKEVLHRFESADFTCEWKYDGERAQIHVLEGGEIRVYSRNSENNTSKYPDIIARMPKVLKDCVTSCVIDAEAVAWDVEKQQILPFQVLSTRKRKDAEMAEIKVQVCVYAFDLLYYNGKSLVKEPLKIRREILRESFNEMEGEFKIATSMDTTSIEEIQEFLEESIKGNCEGLMVKTLEKNATYEIARRSHNWLKLKKDYLEGVGDTLDLVVIGGFHGTGKRTGRYGGFLLACYDEENEEYQVICKIGTGFKDEDLETHANFLKEHVLEGPKPYYRYSEGIRPDHWFEPVQVWEVKAADLSISPVYLAAAGIVDPEKGISLRFPRFLRIREDKKPEDATSCQQVASMYRGQQNVNKASGEAGDPEDFY